jgi:hypothetical protein
MVLRRRSLLQCAAAAFLDFKSGVRQAWATEEPTVDQAPVPRVGDAWKLSSFPEMVITEFNHSDAMMPVISILSKGVDTPLATLVGSTGGSAVTKSADGIEFPANARQSLRFGPTSDPLASYRWVLLAFRLDARSGSSDRLTLINVNNRDIAGGALPKIYFEKGKGVIAVFNGANEQGVREPVRVSVDGLMGDGHTWNCLLVHRRNGRLFIRLNGKSGGESDPATSMFAAPRPLVTMFDEIGDSSPETAAWSLGNVVFGQSELPEATVLKLEASTLWRLQSQSILPARHPYRQSPPVIDGKDFPYRYRHDSAKWNAWSDVVRREQSGTKMGQRKAIISSFERVFYDDFAADTTTSSFAISAPDKNWFGPGWNTSVGGDAVMLSPGDRVDVYQHSSEHDDPIPKSGGMINLALKYDAGWKCGAIYSVNNSGQGRAWGGPKAFRARIKYPHIEEVPGGIFPGFWSYGLEALFWRTSERIEVDFFELDCRDDTYLNGGSSHVHRGQYGGFFGHLAKDAPRIKVFGGRMTEGATGVADGLHFWDGKWHTWEFLIDDDTTYMNVTIDRGAGEEWIELFRCKTPPEYKEKLYLILSQGLRKNLGEPDRDSQYDMFIGSIEVLQRSADLRNCPEIFTKRPEITGKLTAGSVLNCVVELRYPVEDIWYYWYADGHPRGFSPIASYQVKPEDVSQSLRCMVKVVGAVDQPEGWTDHTQPVTAG